MLFVRKNSDDPLTKVCGLWSWFHVYNSHYGWYQNFILQLKSHLLPRVRTLHETAGDFADSSGPSVTTAGIEDLSVLSQVVVQRGRIYQHHLFRVNYTTYDVRRAQDTINPRTNHRDIMLLASSESAHPFLYARVLGIFHANVIYTGQGAKDYLPRRVEFLWVRWFEAVDVPAGWEHAALDSLRFVPMTQDDAYGFVDPTDVIRACHLIPVFSKGRIHPNGVVSRSERDEADWKNYYVNR